MSESSFERIEEKLYRNRYLVDVGRPHIRVRKHLSPSTSLRALTKICPANCYSFDEAGQVKVVADGCLECGTCRVLCEATGEIEWNYPRGGFGILFKFG
ncbi:ferredoxin family protein [Neorhizobium galegae]|uniref:Ferredoxin-like protein n=1 Tax=Neorhizobium galegae TaxID=399 RepID=A0A6A1TJP5_NEOGA|nr:ferredoxin family protein [Neorhizobium galegae]KAB1083540.1 ferredoxin family protein [Neorhizobium galegae]